MKQLLQTVQETIQEKFFKLPSEILKTTKVTKHTYGLVGRNNSYCAIGAILNYYGWDGKNYVGVDENIILEQCDLVVNQYGNYSFTKLGHAVIQLNDRKNKSFSEISQYLEEIGY